MECQYSFPGAANRMERKNFTDGGAAVILGKKKTRKDAAKRRKDAAKRRKDAARQPHKVKRIRAAGGTR